MTSLHGENDNSLKNKMKCQKYAYLQLIDSTITLKCHGGRKPYRGEAGLRFPRHNAERKCKKISSRFLNRTPDVRSAPNFGGIIALASNDSSQKESRWMNPKDPSSGISGIKNQ